jgi:hypothetical protein
MQNRIGSSRSVFGKRGRMPNGITANNTRTSPKRFGTSFRPSPSSVRSTCKRPADTRSSLAEPPD